MPDRPGPLHLRRHELNRQLQQLPILTGDIFCRLGDTRFYGIPFEKLVARATDSPFSHASLAVVQCDQLFLLEVNAWGTLLLRFVDWIDYSAAKHFAVYRLPLTENQRQDLRAAALDCAESDPDYDFTFSDPFKIYCTESVAQLYHHIGISLGQPKTVRELLPGWLYNLIVPINFLFRLLCGASLPLRTPLHFVGNTRHGLLSTAGLAQVYPFEAAN